MVVDTADDDIPVVPLASKATIPKKVLQSSLLFDHNTHLLFRTVSNEIPFIFSMKYGMLTAMETQDN